MGRVLSVFSAGSALAVVAGLFVQETPRRNLRVNLSTVSEELFPLMKRAGFISMVISPDSASAPVLASLRKGFSVEDVHNTARWARASGIRCTWFFLLGGPGETNATAGETVSFVEAHLNCPRLLVVMMTGIRILPGTELARRAMASGYVPPGRDLCDPLFYLSPGLDEAWLIDRINRAIRRCPSIVHGAEETGSRLERWFNWALGQAGVPPPYYRFLPLFLRVPPLPALRAQHAGVRPTLASLRS